MYCSSSSACFSVQCRCFVALSFCSLVCSSSFCLRSSWEEETGESGSVHEQHSNVKKG
jgi:hypothetical protein